MRRVGELRKCHLWATHELPPISWTSRNGRLSYAYGPQGEARYRGEEDGGRALRARPRLQVGGEGAVGPARHRETMAPRIPVVRKRGAAIHGRQAGEVHTRAEGGRGLGRGRRRHEQAGRHGGVRGHVHGAAGEVAQALPRGRRRGAQAKAQGQAEGLEAQAARAHPRAGARGALPKARGGGRLPKKLRALVERDGPWPGRGPRRRPRRGRTGTTWGTCSRAPGRRGRPTATRRRTRPGRRARSCGARWRRSSRARPTGAATARSPCACAPSWARASPTRPCSR